jgi:hypothetical protein
MIFPRKTTCEERIFAAIQLGSTIRLQFRQNGTGPLSKPVKHVLDTNIDMVIQQGGLSRCQISFQMSDHGDDTLNKGVFLDVYLLD